MKRWLMALWSFCFVIIGMCAASSAFAQAGARASTWQPGTMLMAVVSTLVFGFMGILMAIIGFKLFDALTPFNLEQEICEKHNLAVAILCGSMVLGICIIIAVVVL